eukprot:TRINITY_DN78_c0_g2_i1.p1 TRINITY_DN78_c0_g2~~TRINITY_DN78_c0_g2_i1.p1  ORF type:complete len:209 (+),score=20.13 TRINITY_DN78_c0_g2_i1:280-906(+)
MSSRGFANEITSVDASCRNHFRQPIVRSASFIGTKQRPTLVSLDDIIRADPQSALYSFLLRPPGDEHLASPFGVIDLEDGWIKKLYDRLKERWALFEPPEDLPSELTEDPATWHLRTLRKRTFKTEDPLVETPRTRPQAFPIFDLFFGPRTQAYCQRLRDGFLQDPLAMAILETIRRLVRLICRRPSPDSVPLVAQPPWMRKVSRNAH